jgi:DNA-binding GntR family transcriptional regulator
MTIDCAFTLDEVSALNRVSAEPLYLQIAQLMAALIQMRGSLAVGKLLPSEVQVAARLRVSRPTVRQAMAHLLSQGLILRRRGLGTFVAPLKLEHDVSHGFDDDMQAARHSVEYKLLSWEKVTSPGLVAAIFGTVGAERCYWLRRTRSIEGRIIGVEERYIPETLGDALDVESLSTQPIISLLERIVGKPPGWLDIEVSSAVADRTMARTLQVRTGVPTLMRQTTFFAPNGKPLMHGTVTFLAEHYRFRFRVNYAG